MGAVLGVVSLQLAGVCFPAQVLVVDERYRFVSLIARLVLCVSVDSVRGRALGLVGLGLLCGGGVKLDVVGLSGLGHNLVLRCDDSHLNGIRLSLDTDRLLHIVVSLLLGIEARDRVRRQ